MDAIKCRSKKAAEMRLAPGSGPDWRWMEGSVGGRDPGCSLGPGRTGGTHSTRYLIACDPFGVRIRGPVLNHAAWPRAFSL